MIETDIQVAYSLREGDVSAVQAHFGREGITEDKLLVNNGTKINTIKNILKKH